MWVWEERERREKRERTRREREENEKRERKERDQRGSRPFVRILGNFKNLNSELEFQKLEFRT